MILPLPYVYPYQLILPLCGQTVIVVLHPRRRVLHHLLRGVGVYVQGTPSMPSSRRSLTAPWPAGWRGRTRSSTTSSPWPTRARIPPTPLWPVFGAIDMERSRENYHLVALPRYTYKKEINRMTGAAGCRVRRDSVMLVETLITASPEFMNSLPPAEQRALFCGGAGLCLRACRKTEYHLRRGAYGRDNAPYAPLFCPHHKGGQAVG